MALTGGRGRGYSSAVGGGALGRAHGRGMKRISRRGFLKAAGATAIAVSALADTRVTKRPMPRLVLAVCVDCLRRDQVGAYGCAKPTTPCIDRIAAESTVIEHAYANANWTKPSVASFFTGMWPAEHGATASGEVKGEAGSKNMVLPQGVATLAGVYAAAGWRTAGFVHQPHLVKEHGFGQGFERYEVGPFEADTIAKRFSQWHASVAAGERVFAYLHFLDCHAPYWAHQPYASQFGPTDKAWASCPTWRTPGVWLAFRNEVNAGKRTMPREEAQQLLNLYQGAVRYTDNAIGAIIADLEARAVLDDALVVVFADHGEDFLEHGVLGHDPPYFFEEQIRIPMVVRYPTSWGVTPARAPYEAQTLDLTATLAAVAGRKGFGNGRSFLRTKELARPVPIVTQSAAGMTVVRSGLKGYVWTGGAVPQVEKVFDVAKDMSEKEDVAAKSPRFVTETEAYIAEWQKSTARVYAALDGGRTGVNMARETREALRALGYLH